MTKKCTACKTEKPVSEFYPIANGLKGVRPRCKECMRIIEKKKYGDNAEFRWSKLSKQAKKIKDDPEFKKRHMIAQRRWHLNKHYNITQEDFDKKLAEQNGGCEICGRKPNGEQRYRIVVDHCHLTGTNRGLLCDLCNTALGKLGDNIEILNNCINYLKKYGK